MYRLLYKSRSKFSGEPAAVQARIDDLVARASAANARINVTGVLIHMDGMFVQLLEGPMGAVETVFEKICRDNRHTDLQLVELVGAGERIFGHWSMAQLSSAKPQHLPMYTQFIEGFGERVILNPQDAVRQLMRLAADLKRAQKNGSHLAA